jgi:hypothetical protein
MANLGMAFLAIALIFTCSVVLAHEWYSYYCCGGKHCRPVACDQLIKNGSGWEYIPERLTFEPNQILPSQDDNCHICVVDQRPVCAYVQSHS